MCLVVEVEPMDIEVDLNEMRDQIEEVDEVVQVEGISRNEETNKVIVTFTEPN